MGISMTLIDITRNALDREYSLDRAAADLGALMLERELIRRRGDTEAPRLRELEQIIPFQEKLALGKLRGDEIFNRLDLLNIRVEKA
jgi:hypothetical protein